MDISTVSKHYASLILITAQITAYILSIVVTIFKAKSTLVKNVNSTRLILISNITLLLNNLIIDNLL